MRVNIDVLLILEVDPFVLKDFEVFYLLFDLVFFVHVLIYYAQHCCNFEVVDDRIFEGANSA